MMSRKKIISCAITGASDTVGKHPNIPVTPQQIARAAIEAQAAGAAIAHIHVRDPKTGKRSGELALFREVVERVRDSGCNVILNLTTGEGAKFVPGETDPAKGGEGTNFVSPEKRVEHILALRPEICTLDVATMNFNDFVFVNTPGHLRKMATMIRDAGVRPEVEVFDLGHICLAKKLIEEGLITGPAMIQVCLGINWGAAATPESLMFMARQLPETAIWAAFGIGSTEFPIVAQSALLGGHIRVGLEDNLYIERGVLARDNAQLVEKAEKIVRLLGFEAATADEAREILSLRKLS